MRLYFYYGGVMSLILHHGPSGAGKTKVLLAEIIRCHGQNPETFQLIVPTPSDILLYQKKLLSKKPGVPIWNGDSVTTLNKWLLSLLKLSLPRVHLASPSLLRLITRKILLEKNYTGFEHVLNYPSLVKTLTNTFIQIKRAGLGVNKARHALEEQAHSFFEIFEDYQKTLRSLDTVDDGDLVLKTLELLTENNLKLPPDLTHIYFDRIFPLESGERLILAGLNERFPNLEIHVSYSYDYSADENRLFDAGYQFLGNESNRQEYYHLTRESVEISGLFFSDPARELEWVADEIFYLLQEGELPENILVIIPGTRFYQERLYQLLKSKGIPATPAPNYKPSVSSLKTHTQDQLKKILNLFHSQEEVSLQDELALYHAKNNFLEEITFELDLVFGESPKPPMIQNWIEDEWALTRINRSSHHDGITLLTLGEAHSKDSHTTFVVGYCQANYPRIQNENIFLVPDLFLRQDLAEVIKSPRYEHDLAAHYLKDIINRTEKRIYLSYPQILWDGAPQSPSTLYTNLNQVPYEFINSSPQEQSNLKASPAVFPVLVKNTFSITELDTYQKCPFLYYAKYHLKLGQEKTDDVDIPGDVKGRFVHKVLEQILKNNTDLYRDAIDFDIYLKRLFELVPETVNKLANDETFLQNSPIQIREPFLARVSTVINALIADEINLLRQGQKTTLPAYFEWAFGAGDTPPLKIKGDDSDVFISGRIDRIDVNKNGSVFTVIDYKTGELVAASRIKNGAALQIPIYMMAVENILLKGASPAGGLLVGLAELDKKGGIVIKGYGEDEVLTKHGRIDPEEWDLLKEIVLQKIKDVTTQINKGLFDPKPSEPKHCRTCDYKNICHYEGLEEEE